MKKDPSKSLSGKPLLTGDESHDIPRLFAEIVALRKELSRSRMRAANLEAAILAALRAGEDGDIDPLEFLRDELPEINRGNYVP